MGMLHCPCQAQTSVVTLRRGPAMLKPDLNDGEQRCVEQSDGGPDLKYNTKYTGQRPKRENGAEKVWQMMRASVSARRLKE